MAETGHARNVANFATSIAFWQSYGGNYKPTKGKIATDAAIPLSNSRIDRNEIYADDTGLCDRAALVKKYIKSVYGASSPQFEQVSGLEFRKVN